MTTKKIQDFDQNSFQELDDHGILIKLFQGLIRIVQELDDHGILIKFFKDFDQNSGCMYPIIQMTKKFLKNQMTMEFL